MTKGMFWDSNLGCNFGASCIALLSEAPGVDTHLDDDNGINRILAYCKHGYCSLKRTNKVRPIKDQN